MNSGAEATENVVKIARAATGRPGVVVFDNAFHGRTLLALAMTGKVAPYKQGYQPFPSEIYRMPYPYCYRCPFHLDHSTCGLACADYIEEEIKVHVGPQNVACLIVEPVQGGRLHRPPPGWLERIADMCKRLDIPFVADEVQSGFGRTGTLYATEQHPGVEPDFTLSAKSIAAGLPLASVTGRAELMDAPGPGGLGGTYGGNPLACVAALATIELFEQGDLLERARRMGDLDRRLRELGERHRIVGEVRGLGAMMAMELVTDRETKEPAKQATSQVVASSARNGLLTLKAGIHDNVVRILAPWSWRSTCWPRGSTSSTRPWPAPRPEAAAGRVPSRGHEDNHVGRRGGAARPGPGRGGRQPGHRGAAGRGAVGLARPGRCGRGGGQGRLPGWRRTPAGERGELLHGVAAWLREHTDELGRLMTLEGGKPLVENTDEVGWTASAFSYYAELGRHERGRVIPSVEEGQLSLVLKEPVGVVATIVPWNYPLLLAWKVALAAGNTVVVKPPYTPLASLRLAEAFAGFPDGVVNLVTGGAEVGEALVTHGGTSLVAFTGSVATGQRIGALCAERVKRPPGAGRQGRLHRLRRRRPGGRGPRRRLGGLPERRPGLHLGRALLRHGAGVRRVRRPPGHGDQGAAAGRPARPAPTSA